MSTVILKQNKGGATKTWLSTQLAHRLALLGYPTLLITSDSQNNALDYTGFSKEIDKNTTLESWLTNEDGSFVNLRKNLCYIPFTSSKLASNLESKFNYFIDDMQGYRGFKYIIIDASPVLKLDEIFVNAADHIIIPTYLDQVTTNSTIEFLTSVAVEKIRYIVPNRYNRTSRELQIYEGIKDALSGTDIKISTPIKNSSFIANLIASGKTIWETKSKNVDYIKEIIDEIIENTLDLKIEE